MIIRMTYSAQPIPSQISFKNASLSILWGERKLDGLNLVQRLPMSVVARFGFSVKRVKIHISAFFSRGLALRIRFSKTK